MEYLKMGPLAAYRFKRIFFLEFFFLMSCISVLHFPGTLLAASNLFLGQKNPGTFSGTFFPFSTRLYSKQRRFNEGFKTHFTIRN